MRHTAAERAASLFENERVAAFADAILAIFATVAAVPLARVEPEEADGDGDRTAASVLVSKSPSMVIFALTFFVVASAFADSVRLTHRARRMRRRAMVPFVAFLLATSLLPLGFLLTQTTRSQGTDPSAMTAYFVLLAASKASLMVLRAVLQPVLVKEHALQDCTEHCGLAAGIAGCGVLIAVAWILHIRGASAGIAWFGLPVVLGVGRGANRMLALCYPAESAEAGAYHKRYGRWANDGPRMAAFTDGVLAIAATFTLLEIRAPPASLDDDAQGGQAAGIHFAEYLQAHWRDLMSYASSFCVILQLWATHREISGTLPRFGTTLRVLNLASCLCAALIPFGMSLVVNFPGDETALDFALGVVVSAGLAMAAIPIVGRWLIADPDGLPAVAMELIGAEEDSDDEGKPHGATLAPKSPPGEGAPSRRWSARVPGAARTPSLGGGDDSYYGFLVEEDAARDGKTDGREVASAARRLRTVVEPEGGETGDGSDAGEEVGATLGSADPQATDGATGGTPLAPRPAMVASGAFRAREESRSSHGTGGGLDAALLVRRGAGAYDPADLPAALEEHLVRLLVARALVLPALAAASMVVARFTPDAGLFLVPLSWPVIGLIGWAEHGLRRPSSVPSSLARLCLCWTGRPRHIPGVGAVYAMHQGPCCCCSSLRRARSWLCCSAALDLDDPHSPVASSSVAAARRAIHAARRRRSDAETILVAAPSHTSLNGGASTELVSRRV